MAPEQLRGGPIHPTTDVYALGVLLFQLLTGRYPFHSKDRMELERLHLEAPPPRPSTSAPVAPAVDAVVLRCLEKEAERRFPSAPAFLAALREAVEAPSTAASTGRTCQALALHAEVVVAESNQDEELVHTALAEVLDCLEQELRAQGFLLALQAGTALLGIRLLEAGPSPLTGEEARHLYESLRELRRDIEPLAAEVEAHVHLCLHVGPVDVRGEAPELEVLGGAVTELGAWVIRAPSGLHLTPSAAQLLGSSASE
jgi:serine/threonine-protein kinase